MMRATAGATTLALTLLVSPWLSARPSAKGPHATQLALKDAPAPRAGHSAVWTGREMIVWGGDPSLQASRPPLATGGHYDPVRDVWRPTETRGAPSARTAHTAVWIGNEMVVWGGKGSSGLLGDGGAYDPRSRKWRSIPGTGAPSPRRAHVALWTGTEMIVWGGQGKDGKLDDGARWEPTEGMWRPITRIGAPSARWCFAAVWSGKEMLVWGGEGMHNALADGAAYDPVADRWRPLAQHGAPSPRFIPVSVWTGEEMLIWGGRAEAQGDDLSDGGAYLPSEDRWRALATRGSMRRGGLVGVWTGNALLTVGEAADDNVYPPREGSILLRGKDSWTAFHVGFGWHEATIVWTGSAALLWGGFDGTNVENTGVRITP